MQRPADLPAARGAWRRAAARAAAAAGLAAAGVLGTAAPGQAAAATPESFVDTVVTPVVAPGSPDVGLGTSGLKLGTLEFGADGITLQQGELGVTREGLQLGDVTTLPGFQLPANLVSLAN
jgi:hypothetical protein